MTNFDKVSIFMKTFGQEVKNKPSLSDQKINSLRFNLIKEELDELKVALNNKDLIEVAFGIDLDKCFEEVQKSNMSKLNLNGKPIYNQDGKVMKGPNYFKPNFKKFLN